MLTDVQNQPEGVRYLKCVVEGKIKSPLLLVGIEGIGKRFSVTQAVKEVFCTGTKENTCVCFHCLRIKQDNHPDFVTLTSVDGKDLGVDLVRENIEVAGHYPSVAPLKFFFIDDADRLTTPAANALLKTLEEPPSCARFLLATEFYEAVLPTIRSRCGKVLYQPLSEDFVSDSLKKYESDGTKALVYSRMSGGSIGRAIQYWGAGRLALRDRVFTLLQYGLSTDFPSLFSAIDGLNQDLTLVLRFLDQLLYDILMSSVDQNRLINLDLLDSLGTLRGSVPTEKWVQLSNGVRTLREKQQTSNINAQYHLKTLLAEVFAG